MVHNVRRKNSQVESDENNKHIHTLVAQGGPVIFFTPKVSHLGWLGGHISMLTLKKRNFGGGGILQDPLWHPD